MAHAADKQLILLLLIKWNLRLLRHTSFNWRKRLLYIIRNFFGGENPKKRPKGGMFGRHMVKIPTLRPDVYATSMADIDVRHMSARHPTLFSRGDWVFVSGPNHAWIHTCCNICTYIYTLPLCPAPIPAWPAGRSSPGGRGRGSWAAPGSPPET